MAGKPMRQSGAKKKAAAANETSESIAEQTRLFLQSGNKIEVVNSGISGQPTLGKRTWTNHREDSQGK